MSAIITIHNGYFRWRKATEATINIEHLTINTGEHVFIKGPSGCGKSTLLSLLTGINTLTKGSLKVLGHELSELTSSQRDKFRADHMGYIFQQFNLLPYLNVVDNVILPCQFSGVRHKNIRTGELKNSARELLQRLHLAENLHQRPVTELSIGQQQRVAAARALIGQPPLIIADEPTSALDFDNRMAFINLLLEQADKAGSTLIFVSHDATLQGKFHHTIDLQSINQVRVVNL